MILEPLRRLVRVLNPKPAGAPELVGALRLVAQAVVGLADEPRFVRREVEVRRAPRRVDQVLKHALEQTVGLRVRGTHLERFVGKFAELRELVALQDEVHVGGPVEVRDELDEILPAVVRQPLHFGGREGVGIDQRRSARMLEVLVQA